MENARSTDPAPQVLSEGRLDGKRSNLCESPAGINNPRTQSFDLKSVLTGSRRKRNGLTPESTLEERGSSQWISPRTS